MALKYTYNKDGSIKSAVTIPGSTTPFSRKEIAGDEIKKAFKKSKSNLDRAIDHFYMALLQRTTESV